MSGDEEAERIARARAGQAETLQAVLQERFWLPREHLFRVAEGRRLGWRGPWHHWWQSHALAALLDRWDRTGDPASLAQAEAVVEGMRRRGRGRLTNDFYDDLGWLALATGDVDLGDALQAQADAVWTSSGGGPVGHDWSRPCDHPVELSEHVGGLLVVEAAARLADLPRTAGPDTTYTH